MPWTGTPLVYTLWTGWIGLLPGATRHTPYHHLPPLPEVGALPPRHPSLPQHPSPATKQASHVASPPPFCTHPTPPHQPCVATAMRLQPRGVDRQPSRTGPLPGHLPVRTPTRPLARTAFNAPAILRTFTSHAGRRIGTAAIPMDRRGSRTAAANLMPCPGGRSLDSERFQVLMALAQRFGGSCLWRIPVRGTHPTYHSHTLAQRAGRTGGRRVVASRTCGNGGRAGAVAHTRRNAPQAGLPAPSYQRFALTSFSAHGLRGETDNAMVLAERALPRAVPVCVCRVLARRAAWLLDRRRYSLLVGLARAAHCRMPARCGLAGFRIRNAARPTCARRAALYHWRRSGLTLRVRFGAVQWFVNNLPPSHRFRTNILRMGSYDAHSWRPPPPPPPPNTSNLPHWLAPSTVDAFPQLTTSGQRTRYRRPAAAMVVRQRHGSRGGIRDE